LLLTFVALMIISTPGLLLAVEAQENRWAQSIFFENDLFNGTDSNYTNGIKYSLISPDLSPHAKQGHFPRKVLELVHKIPFIRDSGPEYSHKAEFSLGQNMYTPSDISRSDLIVDDRPYAGWLYAGLAYHRKTKFEDHLDFVDSLEIQMGMVGPLSFAEEAQTLVHELRDIPTAEGWDNQLENEPGLLVAFERKWLFSRPSDQLLTADAIVHAGGVVGNVATYLNTGVEVRYGMNLARNFGVSMIRPAGSTLFTTHEQPSIYLFGAVNGKFVLHDIFLDGNTFTDSHSVDKKHTVADLAAGITLSHHNLMLTYSHVTRTKEFDGQDDVHHFGSLTLNFFYPFW
jgi:hypothetical protein